MPHDPAGPGIFGALKAHDVLGASTDGIFIDELLGDLRVDLVETHGDVSMRTTGGSIIDRQQGLEVGVDVGDTAADVIGRDIDLDANGAGSDIGDGDGSNDLDIDSSCVDGAVSETGGCGTGDVALEATSDIYVTETDNSLNLVLAHTYTGDIRLTVRETSVDVDGRAACSGQAEDLCLLAGGPTTSATFAESGTRLPGNDPDAARRQIPNGQIFAEMGNVTLWVGDDIDLHENSAVPRRGRHRDPRRHAAGGPGHRDRLDAELRLRHGAAGPDHRRLRAEARRPGRNLQRIDRTDPRLDHTGLRVHRRRHDPAR